MNSADTIYLLVIGFFTVAFAIKGIKKIFFSAIAFVAAAFVAVSLGDPIGKLLFASSPANDLGDTAINEISKLSDALPTLVGTLIAFVLSFTAIRLLLRLLEFRIGTGVVASVLNRVLGALTGFLLGVSLVFVFSFFFELFSENAANSFLLALKESDIYKFLQFFKIGF